MTDEAWIDTVRLARDFGTVSELFPEEFSDLRDIPFKLFDEIREGMTFLSFEELPDDERPDRKIWDDKVALAVWAKDLRAKRKEKYSTSSDQRIEGETSQNTAALELKHNLGV